MLTTALCSSGSCSRRTSTVSVGTALAAASLYCSWSSYSSLVSFTTRTATRSPTCTTCEAREGSTLGP